MAYVNFNERKRMARLTVPKEGLHEHLRIAEDFLSKVQQETEQFKSVSTSQNGEEREREWFMLLEGYKNKISSISLHEFMSDLLKKGIEQLKISDSPCTVISDTHLCLNCLVKGLEQYS